MTSTEDHAVEPAPTATREDRDLQQLGQRIARALEDVEGAALERARRRLFDGRVERPETSRGWLLLAGAACVGAAAFALLRDPGAAPMSAARGGSPPEAAAASTSPLQPGPDARSHQGTREDGALELVLERGDARGRLGGSTGPRSMSAGPYRVIGEATIVARWDETEGLTLEVSEGEARVLTADQAPRIVTAGTSQSFPPRP